MNAPAKINPVKGKPVAQKPSPLQTLVSLEGEAMGAKDRLSLKHLAVNSPRALIDTGHVFFVSRNRMRLTFEAISSQSTIDKNAPFIQWISAEIRRAMREQDFDAPCTFALKTSGDGGFDYPFTQAFWAPFAPDASTGGLLFTREAKWPDTAQAIPKRLGQIYGLQWTALGRKKRARLSPRKRVIVGSTALFIALAALIPVPVTTLAPAEIVAQSPFIVSAPMDGVIQSLEIAPNSLVEAGQVLARFEDTTYRNEFSIASEEMAVATARQRQAGLSAFVDETTKRELAVAKAEQALAQTRKTYASEMLDKTVLRAQTKGLVLYSDPKDWLGRPVSTGERIMEIANPSQIELRLEAPISDSAALVDKARVRLFLDSDPLNPIEATLSRASYYAAPQAGGELAYESYAQFENLDTPPRIGGRGVAKIYGGTAPLGFWLLRRPISAIRQFIGV